MRYFNNIQFQPKTVIGDFVLLPTGKEAQYDGFDVEAANGTRKYELQTSMTENESGIREIEIHVTDKETSTKERFEYLSISRAYRPVDILKNFIEEALIEFEVHYAI